MPLGCASSGTRARGGEGPRPDLGDSSSGNGSVPVYRIGGEPERITAIEEVAKMRLRMLVSRGSTFDRGVPPLWASSPIVAAESGARRFASLGIALAAGLLAGMSAVAEFDRPTIVAASANRRGAPRCREQRWADVSDYLVGRACPPENFAKVMGYQPVLLETPEGWRYARPPSAHGDCSGPIGNQGPFWDFELVCQTHDYAYDLIRMGVARRSEADAFLYEDMVSSCQRQRKLDGAACRTIAASGRIVLKVGDVLRTGPPPGSAVDPSTRREMPGFPTTSLA